MEMSDAPKPSATRRRSLGARRIETHQAGEHEEIDRDAEKGETGDEKPGDGASAEGQASPSAGSWSRPGQGAHWRGRRHSCRYSPGNA